MPKGSHATCATCRHSQGAKIDAELRAGATLKEIADKYGLSIAGVSRHRARHMNRRFPGPQPAGAHSGLGLSPKQNLQKLRQSAAEILDKSLRSGSSGVAVSAIRESREIDSVLAKLDERDEVSRAAREYLEFAFRIAALAPNSHVKHLADNAWAGIRHCGCENCGNVQQLSNNELTRVRDLLSEVLADPDRWKGGDNFQGGEQVVLGEIGLADDPQPATA